MSTGTAHSFNAKLAHYYITRVHVGQLEDAISMWQQDISDRIAGDGHTIPEIGDALLVLSRELWEHCVLTSTPLQPECLFDLLAVVLDSTAVRQRVWPFLESGANREWLLKSLFDEGSRPVAPAPATPLSGATTVLDSDGPGSEAEGAHAGGRWDEPTDGEVATASSAAAPLSCGVARGQDGFRPADWWRRLRRAYVPLGHRRDRRSV